MTESIRPLLLATFSLRIFCVRCGTEQLLLVHWHGDDEIAYATAQTMGHSCPVQPEFPATAL